MAKEFNGTAEERLAWVKEQASELLGMMSENLLQSVGGGDWDWLDYEDGEVDTYKILVALERFFLIIEGNWTADYFDKK